MCKIRNRQRQRQRQTCRDNKQRNREMGKWEIGRTKTGNSRVMVLRLEKNVIVTQNV